jgi:hypothetical protein
MNENNNDTPKLKVRREIRESAECAHEISLMVDLLAGEITEENRSKLSSQLDSCAVCRAKLDELNRVWSLTREVLMESDPAAGATGGAAASEEGGLDDDQPELAQPAPNGGRKSGKPAGDQSKKNITIKKSFLHNKKVFSKQQNNFLN